MFNVTTTKQLKILDFDVETLAAGFADPNWVPQKITCVSWSWIDSDKVEVEVCGPMGFFKPELRRKMVKKLCDAISQADIVTGHNILKFDLPVINSECMRLDLPTLSAVEAQDTFRIVKSKGFKKGQDNLGKLLKIVEQKQTLDWQGWEDAYEEDGWQTVKNRCMSDVIMHKQLRTEMIDRGWLKRNIVWTP